MHPGAGLLPNPALVDIIPLHREQAMGDVVRRASWGR